MSLTVIKGDLFDPANDFTAIGQGVNCRGIMGAGIAVPFRTKWPKMYEEYVALCEKNSAVLPGTTQMHFADSITIINLFTQYNPGKEAKIEYLEKSAHVMDRDLTNIMTILSRLKDMGLINSIRMKVGLPWIGCGIGGLEKHNVQFVLEKTLSDSFVDYVIVDRD